MKIYILLLFAFVSFNSFSQQQVYNTKVNKANTVIIKSGTVTIGQVIINQEVKTKLFLKDLKQIKDSTGGYITKATFINPEQTRSKDIKITIKCQSPIISAVWSFSGEVTVAFGITEMLNIENGEVSYEAAEISAKTQLIVTIKSKNKIVPTIIGIDGYFNH